MEVSLRENSHMVVVNRAGPPHPYILYYIYENYNKDPLRYLYLQKQSILFQNYR